MNNLSVKTPRKRRVLLISQYVLGDKMAGAGIRFFHLSRVLSRYFEVTLAVQPQSNRALDTIRAKLPDTTVVGFQQGEWSTVKEAAQGAEVIITPPFAIATMPQLLDHPGALVLDGYDPLLAEWLTARQADLPGELLADWSKYMADLYNQYKAADFVICSSERQRYWWLGQLEVAGRVNPITYDQDPSLRKLVDVVPYGLPEDPPDHTRPVIKGVWPGIGNEDLVLLWGGGLWSWLDPMTAVKAVNLLRKSEPRLKLIFPGTIHPDKNVAATLPVRNEEIYQYAQKHGLLDSAVFFGDWVPYDDWQNVLLECDIALSLHHETLETQLAYRSRMLEYIWAGLPIISTVGDATSDLVTGYGLGKVVDVQDVDGVIQAITDILANTSGFHAGFARARQELTWEKALEPLIRFCQNPRRALDRHHDDLAAITHHERKIIELEKLVAAYQSGKFMRLMRRLEDLRARW